MPYKFNLIPFIFNYLGVRKHLDKSITIKTIRFCEYYYCSQNEKTLIICNGQQLSSIMSKPDTGACNKKNKNKLG